MRLLTRSSSALLVVLFFRLVVAWNDDEGNHVLSFQQEEEDKEQLLLKDHHSFRRPGGVVSSVMGSSVLGQEEEDEQFEQNRHLEARELHQIWPSWSQNLFVDQRSRRRRGKGKGGGGKGGRGYFATSYYYGGNPYYHRSRMMRRSRSRRRRRSGRRPQSQRPPGGTFYGVFPSRRPGRFPTVGGVGGGKGRRPNMIRRTPCPTTPRPVTLTPTPANTATPTTAIPSSAPPTTTLQGGATNTTGAPTTLAASPSLFRFNTDMSLTYFSGQPGDIDRDLTDTEFIELQTLIEEFYTNLFRSDPVFATDFVSFTPTFFGGGGGTTSTNTTTTLTTGRNYTAGAVFPPGTPPSLAIPFDSNFEFSSGNNFTNFQILQKMLDVNYTTFITNYLRREPGPTNQLDRVEQVRFDGETA